MQVDGFWRASAKSCSIYDQATGILWQSCRSLRQREPSTGWPIMDGSNGEAVASGPRLNSPPPGSRRYRHPSDLGGTCPSPTRAEGESQLVKPKRTAAEQVEDEAARRALNPLASRQTISDSQAEPEFQANHKRLRADRLAREAGLKAKK
jgi:hypothetical protein